MSEAATAFDQGAVTPEAPPAEPKTPIEQAPESERGWLGGDLQSDPRLEKFKSPEDLAKSYLSVESMIGKSIRIPQQDASDKQRDEFYQKLQSIDGVVRVPSDPEDTEAWNEFYGKMGRPESPDKYTDGDESTRELHHQLGLSDSQSKALLRANERNTKSDAEQQQKAIQEAGESLKAEWGEGAQRNFKNAELAALQFGGDDLVAELKSNPAIGNNVPLLKALADIGDKLGQKKVPLNASADSFNMTIEEANEQIAELRNNEAYQKGEQWAVDKMRMLYKKSTPNG